MAQKGRPSKIADPAFAERLAELYVEGGEIHDIAATLEVDRSSVTRWVRDPRVLVHIKKLSEARTAAITRQIDAELLHRVLDPEHMKKLDTDTLLKVRKELVGRGADGLEPNEGDLEGGLWELMDSNPELAAAFKKLKGE